MRPLNKGLNTHCQRESTHKKAARGNLLICPNERMLFFRLLIEQESKMKLRKGLQQ